MPINWVEIWEADRRNMLSCMLRNMASDIENGYDVFGKSITLQRAEIEISMGAFYAQKELISRLDPAEAAPWCRADLKKRGAIS